jgi:uncharacterized membrane protein YqiK
MSAATSSRTNKTWGRVSARPSEYLIKLRRGHVVKHGSGLSVFLWPGDTCTILPTSIQRTSFVADQITAEKVGVAVTGLAVYRIVEPLLAFRMLDFTSGGNGAEHLSNILCEMFIGAARRLVANMTVEQCLTKRKESIAQELMREILPVVSGQGRPEDSTDQGWGLVIDTIEIQDVRILSEKVFADLQAPFRSHLELEAKKSTVQRDQEIHTRQVTAQREMLEVDQELQGRRNEAEEQSRLQALEREERVKLAQVEQTGRIEQAKLGADLEAQLRARSLADAEFEALQQRAEQEARLARQQAADETELARQRGRQQAEIQRMELETRIAMDELEATSDAELATQQVETERLRGELKVWLQRQSRELENMFSDERIRHELVTCTLPALSQAFVKGLGEVHLTQFSSADGNNGKGFGVLAESVAQLLAVAKASGIDLSQILGKSPGAND